jgi:4-methyl-5(b-hydroxyethyl)-thiazole monophosphate biosynthesis
MTGPKPTAIVLLANGTEEIEALTTADILVRGGAEVVLAGIGSTTLRGRCDLPLAADTTAEAIDAEGTLADLIVIPGGAVGAQNIAESEAANRLIQRHQDAGKLIAAICAAPALVLAPLGILDGKRATCYPGFEERFGSTTVFSEDRVVEDGQLITSRAPGTAIEFALALVARVGGNADEVAKAMLVR